MKPLIPTLAVVAAIAGCGIVPPLAGRDTASALPLVFDAEADIPFLKGQRDLTSSVTGDSPNLAQFANGRLMTVVSRGFGRGAKAGALVELYYPHMAHDNLWDSYVGVRAGGDFRWAHDLRLSGQRLEPDTGMAVSTFRGPGYRLDIADLVRPRSDAHMRRVTVHNDAAAPLPDFAIAFYAYFTLGHLPTGDKFWRDPASGALVQEDSGAGVAVLADRPADAWHLGQALMPFGDRRDARQAAEKRALSGTETAGPFPSGVNGVLEYRFGTLQPGERRDLVFAIGAGANGTTALRTARDSVAGGRPAGTAAGPDRDGALWASLVAEDSAHWKDFLAKARVPGSLPADALPVYRRALITLAQHVTNEGAILAAPTALNPPYRFVWPRDSAYVALALAQAGYPQMAERAFAFLERVQKPSGEFAVNYFPDGLRALWDFGRDGNEHDQPASLAWGVSRLAAITGDQGWLKARWPAVRRSCEFLLGVQQPEGLLGPCRDLWELDTDGTWTYSNGAAWAGLQAGAGLAERMGATADAARYRAAAARLKEAIGTKLEVAGRFARGLKSRGPDTVVESANLALGTPWFGVYPDDHPLMANMGRAVAAKLMTPVGGVRRYEGDRYYDGQPWPVAMAWLAQHRLERGDRPGARALFDSMTRYARETDTLMLGEQFDEARQRWVSAMPLAWSEAMYVSTALALFK